MKKIGRQAIDPVIVAEESSKLFEIWTRNKTVSQAKFGEKYKIGGQAAVGQFLNGDTALSFKAARGFAAGLGCSISDFSPRLAKEAELNAQFSTQPPPLQNDVKERNGPIYLINNADYPSIRRVRFKLSAGAHGFAVDYVDDDAAPIVFQRKWFEGHGYSPDKLLAASVANGSMEPGLYDGDTVVVNTADTDVKDGLVYAMNYEGELVIKRLVRDAGQWWLSSDNPDQRRYPRKVCTADVFCIGRIVHKQSERI